MTTFKDGLFGWHLQGPERLLSFSQREFSGLLTIMTKAKNYFLCDLSIKIKLNLEELNHKTKQHHGNHQIFFFSYFVIKSYLKKINSRVFHVCDQKAASWFTNIFLFLYYWIIAFLDDTTFGIMPCYGLISRK